METVVNNIHVVGIHPGSIPEAAKEWAWIGRKVRDRRQVYFSFDDDLVGAAKALKPVSLMIALEAMKEIGDRSVDIAYINSGKWPIVFSVIDGILIPKDGDIAKAYLSLSAKNLDDSSTWQSGLTRRNGVIRNTLANITDIILNDERWAGVLSFDQFSASVLKVKNPPYQVGSLGEWTDLDDVETSIWLERNFDMSPTPRLVSDAIISAALRNSFHPVRDYFGSLSWDGSRRLDDWAIYFLGADNNEYTKAVSRAWMIGAVARILRPGCKMDNVLILEGMQGSGKSRALQGLGEPWHLDTALDLSSKDFIIAMRGKWIIEMGELDTLNKSDSDRAKQFFSLQSDAFRPPYGRRAETRPRECVFAGSVNSSQYLRDATGGRRFWPIRCRTIDTASLREIRDQLWAEAITAYQAGEPWWIDQSIAQAEQDSRYMVDAWEDPIRAYLASRAGGSVSTAEILGEALELKVDRWGRAEQMRIGTILTRIGYERRKVRAGSTTVWRYFLMGTPS